jgi:hypothetical protein
METRLFQDTPRELRNAEKIPNQRHQKKVYLGVLKFDL